MKSRNPRKPAACLLILWVGRGTGRITPAQLEVASRTTGSLLTTLHGERPDGPRRGELQLACEVMRKAPPWAQLAVLITAIRVALAEDHKLSLAENVILRFLWDAFECSHSMAEVYAQEAGSPLPGLPEEERWWAAYEGADLSNLLTLINQLRRDLLLLDSAWWEPLAPHFKSTRPHKPRSPRVNRRRAILRWRARLIWSGTSLLALGAAGAIYFSNNSRIQFRAVRSTDTIEAYEQFIADHPRSSSATVARARLVHLRDAAAWAAASRTHTLDSYRAYLREHPRGSYRRDAEMGLLGFVKDRIDRAYHQWDIETLEQIALEHEGLVVIADRVEAAIRMLHNDPDWVLLAGDPGHCRDFLARNPSAPRRAEIAKRLAQLEATSPPEKLPEHAP